MLHLRHRWEWVALRRIRMFGYPVTKVRRRCVKCSKLNEFELDGHIVWDDVL